MQLTKEDPAARRAEVIDHMLALGFEVDEQTVNKLCRTLRELTKRTYGCLSVGGSSVKDWIRLQLADRIPAGCRSGDTEHVTAIFHFWPWEVDKYGPPPGGSCGTNVDTMRSPTHRLLDAVPVNRTAWRVAGNAVRKQKASK